MQANRALKIPFIFLINGHGQEPCCGSDDKTGNLEDGALLASEVIDGESIDGRPLGFSGLRKVFEGDLCFTRLIIVAAQCYSLPYANRMRNALRQRPITNIPVDVVDFGCVCLTFRVQCLYLCL